MNNLVKNIGIWLVIGLVVLTVVKQFDARQTTREAVSYSDFMEQAKQGRVESASIEGRTIKWVGTDKKQNMTYSPGDLWMVGDLIKDGVFLNAVYDLRTGQEAGVASTGHALPSPNPEGPFPLIPQPLR